MKRKQFFYAKGVQTLYKFRSFLSTSIDRRIEIDRIDVEKSRIQNTEKSRARRRKIVRAPKIAMRRFYTADIEQSLSNFRSFLSTSIDRVIDIDRIGIEKSMLLGKGESRGESAKNCSVPENRDASILECRKS